VRCHPAVRQLKWIVYTIVSRTDTGHTYTVTMKVLPVWSTPDSNTVVAM
jgi:hypothetical protein